MNREELVIGKSYRVKSLDWFDETKNENSKVINFFDGSEFSKPELCGKSMVLFEIPENSRNNEIQLSIRGEDKWWKDYYLPPFAIEEDPQDTRKPSKETLEFIEKLKAEKFIYGYDGGPGGGNGNTLYMEKQIISPAFNREGEEGIQLKVSGIRRIFTLNSLRELFEKGKTEQRFTVSEWTTIRTELALIPNKEELPKEHSWSTMRD